MASLLSPRRARTRIALTATEPQEERPGATDVVPSAPPAGWLLAAAGGGLLIAVAGWVLVAGFTVVGWLAAEPGTLLQALDVGTELWLLGNGAGAWLGGVTVTLVPWAIPLLLGLLVSRVAAFAGRHSRDRPGRTTLGVAVLMAVSYLAPLMTVALLLGHPLGALRGGLLMSAVVTSSAAWGCARALDYHPTRSWPVWVRAVPRAVVAAQLALLFAGGVLLVTGLVVRFERVAQLVTALSGGVSGNVALLVLQLAFTPNALVWCGSYVLGAGFGLGAASVVAPAGTNLGLLPGVPMLGALPASGPGDASSLWWLAGGVLAGAVAATVVVLTRRRARLDETALVGGVAGALAGAVFTGLAWLSSGDLGVERLVGLGPRLLPLSIMAVSTLGLSGLAAGLLLGLLRLLRQRRREAGR